MGAPSQNEIYVKQNAYEYSPTRSTFTMAVEDLVEVTIVFLSPVTPDDLLHSSLPYSYMEVQVKSIDGESHEVQIYTDISAGVCP